MPKRKTAQRINFTETRLRAISASATERATYLDMKTPGLIARVAVSGKISFILRKRVAGKSSRIMLGQWPGVSIAEARRLALETTVEIGRGIDPLEKRRERRTASQREDAANCTVAEAWTAYRDSHLIPHCSVRTLATDEYLFVALTSLSKRRLDEIETSDVQSLHRRIMSNTAAKRKKKKSTAGTRPHPGGAMANRSILLLQRIIAFAISEMGWAGQNPVVVRSAGVRVRWGAGKRSNAVRLSPEKPRNRVLSEAEIPRLLAVLAESESIFRDFFRMLLFTGMRRSTVQAMAWGDIDLDAGVWSIGGAVIGQKGRAVVCPLTVAAMDILSNRRAADPDGAWVFPSPTSSTGYIVSPKRAWDEVREKVGILDATMHDLRRTFAHYQRLSGSDRPLIAQSLGHAKGSMVTAVYDPLDIELVRQSVEGGTRRMLESGTGDDETGED